MVVPILQNPISTIISRIDRNETQYDPILRENINIIVRRPPITIQAQVVFRRVFAKGSYQANNNEGSMNEGIGGIVENADGYILVRATDLASQSLSLEDIQRGDKITALGQLTVEYYITGKRPAAHYTDQSGFTLMQIFFEDRNP